MQKVKQKQINTASINLFTLQICATVYSLRPQPEAGKLVSPMWVVGPQLLLQPSAVSKSTHLQLRAEPGLI